MLSSILGAHDPAPSPENIAAALGLSSSNDGQPVGINELERMELVLGIAARLQQESEQKQDIILSRFSASHLPALVDRLVDLPSLPAGYRSPPYDIAVEEIFPLKNPYSVILIQLQHLPYFMKYLRSQHITAANGKRLPDVLASRLADLAPKLESNKMLKSNDAMKRDGYQNIVGDACQLLSTLLVDYSRQKDRVGLVSQETKDKLIPHLRQWSSRYRGTFVGDTTGRTLLLLKENGLLLQGVQPMRKKLKGLSECGLLSCNSTTDLKGCSRCRTVSYCSPEHQKMDWSFPQKRHKDYCYTSEY
ncbi:hypothetical protein BKA70DRAFT_1246766 [Coprinopsis sp. MPI-PUGE-AT-0042]|nr:hypothetical protein BKA70DRAFT_1246766 [Coprinopsis sp. MPI-PUGE-AT-0042]